HQRSPSRDNHQRRSRASDRGAVKKSPAGAAANRETGTNDRSEGAAARKAADLIGPSVGQRFFARNASMPRLASPAEKAAWCALSQNLAHARKSASVLRRAYCLFCFIAIGAWPAIVRASASALSRSSAGATTLTVNPASCAWRASRDSPLRTR